MINVTLEFLSDVLGTPVGELAVALKDGEELKPQEEIESFIKQTFDDRLVDAKRSIKDEMYSRGKREALTKKERDLRERLGLTGSTIDDMVAELIEKTKVKPDMTPEDVRNTEIFKLESEKWKKAVDQAEAEANEAKQKYQQKLVAMKVRTNGNRLLKEHNFVVPEGVADESAWSDLLFQRLQQKDVKITLNDDGELMVIDENGSPKKDDRLNTVTFDDHFLNTAKGLFKVAQSDNRTSPGNQNSGQSGQGDSSGSTDVAPNDVSEFMQRVADAKTPDAKREIIAKYGSKFGVAV